MVGLGGAVCRHAHGSAGQEHVPVLQAGARVRRHGRELDPDRAGPPVHPAGRQLLKGGLQPSGPRLPLRPGVGRVGLLGAVAGRPDSVERPAHRALPAERGVRGVRGGGRLRLDRVGPRRARGRRRGAACSASCTRRCSTRTGCRTCTCPRSSRSWCRSPRCRPGARPTTGSRRCQAGSSSTATRPSCSSCRPWWPSLARCEPGPRSARPSTGATSLTVRGTTTCGIRA